MRAYPDMDSIGRRAASPEPVRGESRPGPPTPFDVRREGWRTEPNCITTHTKSTHTQSPAQFKVCIFQASNCVAEDAPKYLYSQVRHITNFTDSTRTHDREPERSEGKGMYTYTSDLIQLEACRTNLNCKLPEEALEIVTPLVAQAWEKALAKHSDKEFRQYIIQGIRQSFTLDSMVQCTVLKGQSGTCSPQRSTRVQ